MVRLSRTRPQRTSWRLRAPNEHSVSGLVVDASALAEYLLGTPAGEEVADRLAEHARGGLHVPHLAVVETASVVRGWERSGQIFPRRAAAALVDLVDFPAVRWAADPLVPRIWELRANLTAYDATYIALAEELSTPLLTGDRRLARGAAPLARCPILTVR